MSGQVSVQDIIRITTTHPHHHHHHHHHHHPQQQQPQPQQPPQEQQQRELRPGTLGDSCYSSHWVQVGSKERSVMWLKYFLCMLYVLQLVVLSGMVAAYFYNIVKPPWPPEETAPPASTAAPPSPPGNDDSPIVEPKVKLKPISLSYLKEHITSATSPLDLIRLFVDDPMDDQLLSQWMSRNIRSAPLSSSHDLRLSHHEGKRTLNQLKKYHGMDKTTQVKGTHAIGHQMTGLKNSKENTLIQISTEGHRANLTKDFSNINEYQQDKPKPSNDLLETFEAALHNIEEMKDCPVSRCKDPKPYVQYVTDPSNSHLIYLPECTIVYRCMNYSGCCHNLNSDCMPKTTNFVNKSFLVVDRLNLDGNSVNFHPSMAISITFMNHTECFCKPKPPLPECEKMCPKPFKRIQQGINCTCECIQEMVEARRPCDGVPDGLRPLSQEGLVCIKEGKCYSPYCKVGTFDIKSGFCPLSEEYALPSLFFKNPDDRYHHRDHLRSFDFTKSAVEPLHEYLKTLQDKLKAETAKVNSTEDTDGTSNGGNVGHLSEVTDDSSTVKAIAEMRNNKSENVSLEPFLSDNCTKAFASTGAENTTGSRNNPSRDEVTTQKSDSPPTASATLKPLLPLKENIGFQGSSHYHEDFRPHRPKKQPNRKNVQQEDDLAKPAAKPNKTAPRKSKPKAQKGTRKPRRKPKPQRSRAVRRDLAGRGSGVVLYDFTPVVEGSGEDFTDDIT